MSRRVQVNIIGDGGGGASRPEVEPFSDPGRPSPSAASTHQCPGRNRKWGEDVRCHHQVPFHIFACKAHWFMIPHALRARLWREWDENPGEDSYFEVRAECLAAVGVPVDEIADENGGVPLGGVRG